MGTALPRPRLLLLKRLLNHTGRKEEEETACHLFAVHSPIRSGEEAPSLVDRSSNNFRPPLLSACLWLGVDVLSLPALCQLQSVIHPATTPPPLGRPTSHTLSTTTHTMSNTDFLGRAIDQVRKAIEADNAAQYDKAYQLYYQSLELFMLALKWEKNPKSKEMIRQKTGEYMDRAEKLKAHLSDADAKRKKPGMVGANGSSTGGTGKGKEGGEDGAAVDEDSKKLRSALAGAILQDRPNVKWEDVAGLEAAKEALKEAVLLPIKFPQMFQGNRKPWKGILLYGPPGTGKSYLAKALATEAKSTFFSVSSSDLVSKWMGESERYVKLFCMVMRFLQLIAKAVANSVAR